MKLRIPLMLICLMLILTSCSNVKDSPPTNGDKSSEEESNSAIDVSEKSKESSSNDNTEEKVAGAGTLFIGSHGNFKEIVLEEGADTSPDALIAAIAKETGWNLDLAEPVSTGKEGSTVIFSSNSAIFTGPPMEQKDDYHVYDSYGLVSSILDSVWQTLRYNAFTDPKAADLDAYHVYFATEGDVAIEIPDSDVVISTLEPYPGFENFPID